MDDGYNQKQMWLDEFAPFFQKDKRIIISRESNNFKSSAELKSEFIKNFQRDDSILIFIDDDPLILKTVMEINKDVIPLKDTALVD